LLGKEGGRAGNHGVGWPSCLKELLNKLRMKGEKGGPQPKNPINKENKADDTTKVYGENCPLEMAPQQRLGCSGPQSKKKVGNKKPEGKKRPLLQRNRRK